MAQGNAARSDTSMEDILASIRRIIDENDGDDASAKRSAANDAPSRGAKSAQELAEGELTGSADQKQPKKPLATTAAKPATEQTTDTDDDEVDSLTNVLARLDAEIDEKKARGDIGRSYDKAASAQTKPAVQDHGPAATPKRDGKYEARFSDADRSAFKQVGHALAAEAATPRTRDIRPNQLISSETSHTVAQSFSALAEAFEAGTGQDLTAMAEDLLKPMLSDWLDNNLPQIVERLVRAEIERVARGDTRAG